MSRRRSRDGGRRSPGERWLISPSRGAGILTGLVFPSSYFVGMSNLGFHVIYRLLAMRSSTRVERLFDPGPRERPVRSVESGRPAGDFDVLAFSCAFEPDYLNLIRMLIQSGIEPLRRERSERSPLLMAGGIAPTSNPAALSEVIDVLILGDGEEVLDEVWDVLEEDLWTGGRKEALLARLATIPGAYVPAVHGVNPEHELSKRSVENLSRVPSGSICLTAETEFSEVFLLEAARGCVRGCSFCLIGHWMSKLKIRSLDSMIHQIEQVRPELKRVGLVASEIACHPKLGELCEYLLSNGLEVSVSSVEIDRLSPELMDLLVRAGQRTMTIAPESGDERFRFGLGKRIPDERFFEMARRAGRAGVERLKMYLILGMPHSTPGEVESLVRFVNRVREDFLTASSGGMLREVAVSINPFVPKPHTPWESEPMLPEKEYKRRVLEVRRQLGRVGGVRITSWSPSAGALDAMLSLSDSTVGPMIVKSLREGLALRELTRRLAEEGVVDPYRGRSVDRNCLWKMIQQDENV